jgi:hypothetical protein
VGPRTRLVDMEKWQFFILLGLNSDTSVVQPVASRCAECTVQALQYHYCVTTFIFLLAVRNGAQKGMLCLGAVHPIRRRN